MLSRRKAEGSLEKQHPWQMQRQKGPSMPRGQLRAARSRAQGASGGNEPMCAGHRAARGNASEILASEAEPGAGGSHGPPGLASSVGSMPGAGPPGGCAGSPGRPGLGLNEGQELRSLGTRAVAFSQLFPHSWPWGSSWTPAFHRSHHLRSAHRLVGNQGLLPSGPAQAWVAGSLLTTESCPVPPPALRWGN